MVDVYKYTKVFDGKKIPSGVLLLTFDLYNPPESLDISWYKVKVREYIPNLMRCKNCQLLGHTLKRCKNSPSSVNCNLPPHSPTDCTRSYCANCAEDHPASSNKCTKYIQQKEVLKIKTKQKCTMREAITIHKEQTRINNPSSYSSIASTNIETTSKPKTKILSTNTNLQTTEKNTDKLSSILQSKSINNLTTDLNKTHENIPSSNPSTSQITSKTKLQNNNYVDPTTTKFQNNNYEHPSTTIQNNYYEHLTTTTTPTFTCSLRANTHLNSPNHSIDLSEPSSDTEK